MNIDNAKSQMRKGMLEYCVLLLLRRRPSYASDIILRLKEASLLSYEWQESTQGPPRKYYALTPLGEEFLASLDAAWSEIENTVSILKR